MTLTFYNLCKLFIVSVSRMTLRHHVSSPNPCQCVPRLIPVIDAAAPLPSWIQRLVIIILFRYFSTQPSAS